MTMSKLNWFTKSEDQTKRVRKIYVLLITLLIVTIMFSNKLFASEQNDARVAATKGLSNWLHVIPTKDLANYGFSDEIEFNKTTLDEPLPLYYIDLKHISNYKGEDISSILSPFSGRWLFPVKVESQIRSLLTVARVNNHYEVVSIGEASIANQLNSITAKLSADKDDHNIKFVKILGPLSYSNFILSGKETKNLKLTPLESARVVLNLEKTAKTQEISFKPNDMLFMLKKSINKNPQQEKKGKEILR